MEASAATNNKMSQGAMLNDFNIHPGSPAMSGFNQNFNASGYQPIRNNPENYCNQHMSSHQCNFNASLMSSGGCVHYHNHYEGQNQQDKELLREYINKIGESLTQLRQKDELIQKLVNS